MVQANSAKALNQLPRPVRYFFSAAGARTIALFTLVFVQWLNLPDHSSLSTVHRFHAQALMLLVDATMLYFLVKRKRFSWVYEMVTVAILCEVFFYQFRSHALRFTETTTLFLYATVIGLLCGFLPATLRWFWRQQKQSEEERLIQNMETANGATAPLDSALSVRATPDAITDEASKPLWTIWKSLGLIFMIGLSILATWLVIHAIKDGRASNRGQIADIHADPKHYWFYVTCNLAYCVPVYTLTIKMWRNWRASNRP